MKKDGYEQIIDMMRNQGSYNNPESISMGIVVSTNPLQIALGELALTRDNLLINKTLLDYTETVSATTSTNDSHSHTVTTIEHKSIISVGDSVALYRIGEKYLVLCICN